MLPLAVISGRVVDEAGTPVRGALVGAAGEGDCSVGRTNLQGRFALGIVSASPVRVMTRKAGFSFAIRGGISPWTDDLELVLSRVGSLSGRIVADPMPRYFRIRLLRREGDRWARGTMLSVLRRPGGIFSAHRVRPGLYQIGVEAEGYEAEGPAVIDMGPGEEVVGLELALTSIR